VLFAQVSEWSRTLSQGAECCFLCCHYFL